MISGMKMRKIIEGKISFQAESFILEKGIAEGLMKFTIG
jgi:hypothetical protein